MIFDSHTNEIALALAILLTSCSQLLLRIGARNKIKSADIFLNIATFLGYLIFIIVILLTIYAMQKIQLKTTMAWTAITYVLTPIMSYLLIKEPLDKRMITGSITIVIGILIFIQ